MTPSVQFDLSSDGARKLSTTVWWTGSDSRVKLNIVDADISICYNNVKNLALRRFGWDPEYYPDVIDKTVVGFISQEVEDILPKAVTFTKEKGFDDFRTLDTDQIYKMHFGCTKKLIIDKEILESKVATLEAQLAALLTQLNISL
jgi:hypothetical protein